MTTIEKNISPALLNTPQKTSQLQCENEKKNAETFIEKTVNEDRFEISNNLESAGIYSPTEICSNTYKNNNEEFDAIQNEITASASEEKTLSCKKYYQENTNWCWVACAKTALEFVGVKKSQEEIYKAGKNTETVENKTGTFSDINRAIKEFDDTTFSTSTNPTYNLIKNRINSRNIVIIRGLKGNSTVGHDLICYGYESDPDNDTYVLKIFDPSNIDGGEGTLTCSKTSATTYTLSTEKGSADITFTATDYMYGK